MCVGDISAYVYGNIAITSVTSIVYVVLLIVFYIKLSKKIDGHSCTNQVSSNSTGAQPEKHTSSTAGQETVRIRPPSYGGDNDTSSDSSDDSDSSPSPIQCPRSSDGINYTTVIFPPPGHSANAVQDYENMKVKTDYVNVDPTERKVDFWACRNAVAAASVEYTQVKL